MLARRPPCSPQETGHAQTPDVSKPQARWRHARDGCVRHADRADAAVCTDAARAPLLLRAVGLLRAPRRMLRSLRHGFLRLAEAVDKKQKPLELVEALSLFLPWTEGMSMRTPHGCSETLEGDRAPESRDTSRDTKRARAHFSFMTTPHLGVELSRLGYPRYANELRELHHTLNAFCNPQVPGAEVPRCMSHSSSHIVVTVSNPNFPIYIPLMNSRF